MQAPTTNSPSTATDTSKFVKTPGWNLHYHELGTGPAVLFLHGSGPGATGWSNFHRNIEAIARTHRVLVLDQPGWGESDSLENAPGGHLQAIREFLDALEIERLSLIGNSLGAVNAIEFAIQEPDRVERIVTMGAPDLSQPNVFSPAGFSLGLQEVYRGFEVRTPEAYRRLVDVMTFGEEFLADELIEERLDAALRNEHHLDAFLARAGAPREGAVDWTPAALAKLEHPTLLIHGRDDQVVPFESTLKLLTALPNSRALLFNQCGHWAQLEKADEFNVVVSAFLNGS